MDHKTKIQNKTSDTKHKLDSEDLLINTIGSFGKYQFWLFVFGAIIANFEGWSIDEYIFTTAKITKRCLIPECDDINPEFTPSWILNAIPGTSNTTIEECIRYSRSNVTDVIDGFCSKELFDFDKTEPCVEFVYENTNTVVYDFDLGCDEWRRSVLGTIRMLGKAFSHSLTGYVSDKWGRKKALAINLINRVILSLIRVWANSYYMFAVLEFTEALAGSGAWVCIYVLSAEFTGVKHREMSIAIFTSVTCLGHFVQAAIAMLIPNWRYFTLTLFSIMLIALTFLPFIHESVRWLISTNQHEKAEKIIRKIAKINKKNVSEDIMIQLHAQKKNNEIAKENEIREPWLPVIVWRNKKILRNLVVASIWNATIKLVLFGLTLNSTSFSGNMYLNYSIVYFAGFIGYFATIFITPLLKRRTIMCSGLLVCGVCMFTFIILSDGYKNLSIAFYLMGNMVIGLLINTMYIYVLELFPTKYRHNLFAITNFVGQLGAVIAPLTPAMERESVIAASVWVNLPYALYGGFCLLSGALVFIIPETSGLNLPDTIEDVCKMNE